MKKLYLTLFLLSLSAHCLFAQWTPDTLYYEFDEIEVTATKTSRTLSEIPGRVDVLTSDMMATVPSLTLVDKIRAVSGINTSSSFGMFTMRPNVTLRGLSGEDQSRTLVMIDGIPINNSDTGGVNWNSVHTGSVRQVEVYKGPGSSLYGSNAMGGVINIITQTPDVSFSGSAGISYGTFNTLQNHIHINSRPNDRLSLQLGAFYNYSDGYITTPDSLRTDFDKETYGQRWQVETVFSMIKRNQGDALGARSYWAQNREMMLKVLTHNIGIILFVKELFYRAGQTPFYG